MANLIHNKKFLIVDEDTSLIKEEVYNYVWKEGTDEPIKEMDDSLDSARYGVFTDAYFNGEYIEVDEEEQEDRTRRR